MSAYETFDVSIILPAYNEEKNLEHCINETIKTANFENISYEVIIAENGSIDKTFEIAQKLSKKFSSVNAIHLDKPGFLAAIKKGFDLAKGSVVIHLDVDLSTEMSHFKELVKYSKEYDVVTGSRYLEKSSAKRTFARLILSKAFNILLMNGLLRSKIKDNNCGFRAIKKNVGIQIFDEIENFTGFGNAEFIILAQRKGFSIKEFPVKWTENIYNVKFKWISEFFIPSFKLWYRLLKLKDI